MQQVLEIIIALSKGNQSTESLCKAFEISTATLKRQIAEARHLGAKIEAVKNGKKSEYQLDNWKDCRVRTERWHELNTAQNLREQKELAI